MCAGTSAAASFGKSAVGGSLVDGASYAILNEAESAAGR